MDGVQGKAFHCFVLVLDTDIFYCRGSFARKITRAEAQLRKTREKKKESDLV